MASAAGHGTMAGQRPQLDTGARTGGTTAAAMDAYEKQCEPSQSGGRQKNKKNYL